MSEAEVEDWTKLLKSKFGTKLKKVDSFEDTSILAQFDSNTNTILYKDDVTEYIMAHESYHAQEMHEIGFDEYVKGAALKGTKKKNYTPENWQRLYKREKYVYDQLVKNAKKHNLNSFELRHAFIYLDLDIIIKMEKLNIEIPKI